MKRQFSSLIIICSLCFSAAAQQKPQPEINVQQLREDVNAMVSAIERGYVYLDQKHIDLACIKQEYLQKAEEVKSFKDQVLLFEYLINEVYDSHMSLNANIPESYRLSAPVYAYTKDKKTSIKNVWQSQISYLEHNVIGAEILEFNGTDFSQKIDEFPSQCLDKTKVDIRNWLGNKILAGKYTEPRILTLKLLTGEKIDFDLDSLQFKEHDELLSIRVIDDVGVIRVNNSLGNNQLIEQFDKALETLFDTKGLVIDLRNSPSGGNSYVAKGILGRFISSQKPYQKHEYTESWDGQAQIVRTWLELVNPRGKQYTKPLVIMVGRWTGSMGEGIAVGFDGMQRADIVGTEMSRLAGSDYDFNLQHQRFGYKVVAEKIFHIDGTPRESFIPAHYVEQTRIKVDQALERAMSIFAE